jgi:S-disulfanyl-L-cysteine oxidoreductase SoxD
MRNKSAPLGLIFVAAYLASIAPSKAQPTTQSVWDGVYTDAQAGRGKAQYMQRCSVCHDASLEGSSEAPPLVGRFIPDWAGTTLADLYDKIQVTMPLEAPGTLRPATTADILAYLLEANNFPAGSKELTPAPDYLGTIGFDVLKPKASARVTK